MRHPSLDVPVRRYSGSEAIGTSGKTVVEFWRWSSDLLENIQRGIFAEYIVATALGVADETRVGWTGYDLRYGHWKVEVKSSSYLQSWKQREVSRPVFGIGPREQWDEETGLFSDPRYVADVFIFCLLAHIDPMTVDILNLDQWQFFVVATKSLLECLPTARSISEKRLRAVTAPVNYGLLRQRIDDVLANPESFLIAKSTRLERARDDETVSYTYVVAQRGTRANPVIVTAPDYLEAFKLARADATIFSFGENISSIRLSAPALEAILAAGARDLRTES